MIVGFAQLRNELSNGNLHGWFQDMYRFCDAIYIYDQASNDGSLDYYATQENVSVIRSTTNNFENELLCKRILLQKLLREKPETDWVFWMDGDTRLDSRLTREVVTDMLSDAKQNLVDGVSLGHYNLWRSDCYYRLDNDYHNFHKWGRIPFWRNNGRLEFPMEMGPHKSQEPFGLTNVIRSDYSLIHKGFATDSAILSRYNLYKSMGQKGPMLDRLIDESKLWVKPMPDILPYTPNGVNPKTLKLLKEHNAAV